MKRESRGANPNKSSVSIEPSLGLANRDNRAGLPLLKNIAEDQKALPIARKHLRFWKADWLVPLGEAMAAVLATATRFNFLCSQQSACSRNDKLMNGGQP